MKGLAHSNPMVWNLGSVAVGSAATAKLRYWNFCGDQQVKVVGLSWSGQTGMLPSEAFQVTSGPVRGEAMQQEKIVQVTYAPTTSGTHAATLRFIVTHGYYETQFSGMGVVRE